MSEPVPPEDVRVVMDDGRVIPIECVYVGYRAGLHVWAAVWNLPEDPVRVQIGMMPARTMVVAGVGVERG
jgi:hypothetical protein